MSRIPSQDAADEAVRHHAAQAEGSLREMRLAIEADDAQGVRRWLREATTQAIEAGRVQPVSTEAVRANNAAQTALGEAMDWQRRKEFGCTAFVAGVVRAAGRQALHG